MHPRDAIVTFELALGPLLAIEVALTDLLPLGHAGLLAFDPGRALDPLLAVRRSRLLALDIPLANLLALDVPLADLLAFSGASLLTLFDALRSLRAVGPLLALHALG